jgi:hypothetical protein
VGRTGLRGQPLVALRQGELIAWATEMPGADWTRADLLAHHAIVERIFASAEACLPARFGTPVTIDLLQQRYADLVGALERVRGRTELAVTATWLQPTERPLTGRAYLQARAHALKRAEQLAGEIERAIEGEFVEVEHHILPSRVLAVRSALLVPRNRAEIVKQRLPLDARDVRILVNGPWPPYSFAAVGGSAREA